MVRYASIRAFQYSSLRVSMWCCCGLVRLGEDQGRVRGKNVATNIVTQCSSRRLRIDSTDWDLAPKSFSELPSPDFYYKVDLSTGQAARSSLQVSATLVPLSNSTTIFWGTRYAQ